MSFFAINNLAENRRLPIRQTLSACLTPTMDNEAARINALTAGLDALENACR
jgi:hypothetical protein